ncbi:MAG: hemin uptake protein HemP [Bauldia litoralis]
MYFTNAYDEIECIAITYRACDAMIPNIRVFIGIRISTMKERSVDMTQDGGRRGERHVVRVSDGVVDSQELFQKEREIRIRHGDQTYRLRLTGLNKLILTK